MSKLIFIATGGTGGHIFPAVALAEELITHKMQVEYVTDYRALTWKEEFNAPYHVLVEHKPGKSLAEKAKFVYAMIVALLRAIAMVRHRSPAAVVGFGGYISVPLIIAARLFKVKIILFEPNVVMGRANLFLSRWADLVVAAKPLLNHSILLKKVKNQKLVYLGVPIRGKVLSSCQKDFVLPDKEFNVLVLGGSQGAAVFAEVVPEAFKHLPSKLRQRFRITQQARPEHVAELQDKYHKMGMEAKIASFFSNVGELLSTSHLVIARAGASTVAEVLVHGRPMILMPLPNSADNHQYYNAEYITRERSGWLVLQSDPHPAMEIKHIIEMIVYNPQLLKQKALAASKLANIKAATQFADLVAKLCN